MNTNRIYSLHISNILIYSASYVHGVELWLKLLILLKIVVSWHLKGVILDLIFQKRPPEVFIEKSVFKNFA